MAAVIISAFPGLGKTYMFKELKDRLKILDLNTGRFEGDEFPGNYIEEIEKKVNDYDLIFVSSHRDVRYALDDAGIDFDLLYPSRERKNEFIEIYVTRRNNRDFVMKMDHNFYDIIDEIDDEDLTHCYKHKLERPHTFISSFQPLVRYVNDVIKERSSGETESSNITVVNESEQTPVVTKEEDNSQKSEHQRIYEDFQIKNITSLIDKCDIGDDSKGIPSEFKNITITASEYNTLLYVRTKLKSIL